MKTARSDPRRPRTPNAHTSTAAGARCALRERGGVKFERQRQKGGGLAAAGLTSVDFLQRLVGEEAEASVRHDTQNSGGEASIQRL